MPFSVGSSIPLSRLSASDSSRCCSGRAQDPGPSLRSLPLGFPTVQNCCTRKSTSLPNAFSFRWVSVSLCHETTCSQEVFCKIEYSHWQPQQCRKCQSLTWHTFSWVSSAFLRESKHSYYCLHAVVATYPLYFRYTSHTSDTSDELCLSFCIDCCRSSGWLPDVFVYMVDD